jgi:hypothetical protein
VDAIRNWGPCKTLSEVRAFLGTVGVMRFFIRNFAHRVHHLVKLTRKDVNFEWGEEQDVAQKDLKMALITSPASDRYTTVATRQLTCTLHSPPLSEQTPLGHSDSENCPRTVRVVRSDYTQTDLVINIYTFEILSELSPSAVSARLVEICMKSHKIMCAEQELNHRPLHYESYDCQVWTLNHLSQMVIVKHVTNV